MPVTFAPAPQAKDLPPVSELPAGDPPDTLVWADLPDAAPQPRTTDRRPAPVFVYGALRSGTTMFRLMLDHHPRIANPGEVDFLFDYLIPCNMHPTGWRYDLTGLRRNRIFQSQGLELPAGMDGLELLHDMVRQMTERTAPGARVTFNIHRNLHIMNWIYPEAPVIHVLRDPRDVARSAVQMGWAHHLYHAVTPWIAVESDWECVAPWLGQSQVLTLRYERLVAGAEDELRRVCRFLGLGWSAEMLSYVRTSSYGVPDPALIGQWRTRCDPDHIALLEGRAGMLMSARGYAVTGRERHPGLGERTTLAVPEKIGTWRAGMQIYGPAIFFGEKLSRHLRVPGMQAWLRARMNRVETARLK